MESVDQKPLLLRVKLWSERGTVDKWSQRKGERRVREKTDSVSPYLDAPFLICEELTFDNIQQCPWASFQGPFTLDLQYILLPKSPCSPLQVSQLLTIFFNCEIINTFSQYSGIVCVWDSAKIGKFGEFFKNNGSVCQFYISQQDHVGLEGPARIGGQ